MMRGASGLSLQVPGELRKSKFEEATLHSGGPLLSIAITLPIPECSPSLIDNGDQSLGVEKRMSRQKITGLVQ